MEKQITESTEKKREGTEVFQGKPEKLSQRLPGMLPRLVTWSGCFGRRENGYNDGIGWLAARGQHPMEALHRLTSVCVLDPAG